MAFREVSMKERKRIALVAHDNKKQDLLEWAAFNRDLFGSTRAVRDGNDGRLLGAGASILT